MPIVNERRGRLREADTTLFLRNLARLPIVIDRAPEKAAVLALARRYGLTVYAASYLELAERHAAALATLDAALAQAAQREDIPLIGHKTPVTRSTLHLINRRAENHTYKS